MNMPKYARLTPQGREPLIERLQRGRDCQKRRKLCKSVQSPTPADGRSQRSHWLFPEVRHFLCFYAEFTHTSLHWQHVQIKVSMDLRANG
jgi:hypothetical protein